MLVEPVFADFYTPRLGTVLDALEREAPRIGYWDMLVQGEVRMVRRRVGGGYFTVLTPRPGTSPAKRIAFRCRDVHLAVGYPGLKFLPDLQEFRRSTRLPPRGERLRGPRARLRRAAAPAGHRPGPRRRHRRVADPGAADPGPRPVRPQTRIVHLLRTYVDGSHGPHRGRAAAAGTASPTRASTTRSRCGADSSRPGCAAWTATGGAGYDEIGGTTTAFRRALAAPAREGRRGGWYRTVTGTIEQMRSRGPGRC